MDKLLGRGLSAEDIKYADSYVHKDMGLFIPGLAESGEPLISSAGRPSYMILVSFKGTARDEFHYNAEIYSPGFANADTDRQHYYCLLIDHAYFDERYLMYAREVPVFKGQRFEICSDILKALNTFAFESSKSMMNSDITLSAQTEIITHWIIRSIMGETLDMRAISDDYSVARAQHYIELHYAENITVSELARLGCVSLSTFNRRFRKETGRSPIDYLIEVRINHAKNILRRRNVSVTEAAMRCGFGSSAHFAACFQQKTGSTPSEYRNKYIK